MTPQESTLEHCRNILQAFVRPVGWEGGCVFTVQETAAIVARLRAIQRELESTTATRHDGVYLRAVGDHIERVYPEAASGTDEDYGPILPPAAMDGASFPGQPSEDT